MQEAKAFPLDIGAIVREENLYNLGFSLSPGARIFFHGDLGSGKSTFIRMLLRTHFSDPNLIVRSPTYTYFQKYGDNIYHFDLYRLASLEDFFLIGGSDILDDKTNICLFEWPEILSDTIIPTHEIFIEKMGDSERKITFRHGKSTESLRNTPLP